MTQNKNLKFGFSLIEILIVISITAILISIAYPNYQHHIVQVKRNEAKMGLTELAAKLENYYSLNNQYAGATLTNLGMETETYDHSYQFEITQLTNLTYQITATPLGNQAKLDQNCGNLLLDQTGEKSITGSMPVEYCW